MKHIYSWKNISRNLIGLVVLLFVTMSCFRDSKYDDPSKSPTVTPTPQNTSTSNSKSPSPTLSPSSSPANSTNSSTVKNSSYQGNLPSGFRLPDDAVGKRILSDYGALYVAKGGVTAPLTVMFSSESECSSWQSQLKTSKESVGGVTIELQTPAMTALQAAVSEASAAGVKITPTGSDAARRSYADTLTLWASRVNPALAYWVGKGRLKQEDANRIKALSPPQQVPEVLKLEEEGIFFSKDFSKSILYSVAAPGTSQHLSMLALDVSENTNVKAREILAKHGWYQTVVSDLPHFTYLGLPESDLPGIGLKKTENADRSFWVPAL